MSSHSIPLKPDLRIHALAVIIGTRSGAATVMGLMGRHITQRGQSRASHVYIVPVPLPWVSPAGHQLGLCVASALLLA